MSIVYGRYVKSPHTYTYRTEWFPLVNESTPEGLRSAEKEYGQRRAGSRRGECDVRVSHRDEVQHSVGGSTEQHDREVIAFSQRQRVMMSMRLRHPFFTAAGRSVRRCRWNCGIVSAGFLKLRLKTECSQRSAADMSPRSLRDFAVCTVEHSIAGRGSTDRCLQTPLRSPKAARHDKHAPDTFISRRM
jgi:hypothetical protein